ncbi:MAG: T9SS type A sorting domain-containing protein [Bacteroidetes bacterium]|nr:T9SS type A sorting domain-containing protein [Bacteroidota bacterium]
MQKNYLLSLLTLLLLSNIAYSQATFSDDFESYTVGQTIGVASPVWGTWSGNLASEDAPVSNEQAHSGTNSVKFYTTSASGGPSDVILPFGGAYNTGDFNLQMWMYVVTGRGAYFNVQANTTTGQKWSADLYFDLNGKLNVNADGNTLAVIVDANYPVGKWFKLNIVTDLSSNKWKVLVDDVEVGAFANPSNQLASIDLFAYGPSGSLGHYYIDDVSYTYAPLVKKPNDAVMYGISSRTIGLTGDQLPVTATVRNIGVNPITSFDVILDNGSSTQTVNITNQNIASLGVYKANLPNPYTLIDGPQNLKVTIANVNGGTDDNPSNNEGVATLRGYTPAPGKHVVVEEATGTWCQWCVRGIVYMALMRDRYPDHFVGIGVHNADPMAIAEYDGGLTATPGFSGFPSVLLQRKTLLDPSAIERPILEELTIPAPATLLNGADYDATTGILKVSVSAQFTQAVSGVYRLNAVILEDEVTGTASGYAQKNAYAGGANGVMGGFETKPSTIPASQMVYNDVARAILGGFYGLDNSVPGSVAAGETATANFTFTLGTDNDFDKMHIAGILYGPDGEIVNATLTTADQAVANGFVSAVSDVVAANSLRIAPNPASGITYVNLALTKPADISVRLFNALGQEVRTLHYGNFSGSQILPLDVTNLQNGVYTVQVIAGAQTISEKLVVRN